MYSDTHCARSIDVPDVSSCGVVDGGQVRGVRPSFGRSCGFGGVCDAGAHVDLLFSFADIIALGKIRNETGLLISLPVLRPLVLADPPWNRISFPYSVFQPAVHNLVKDFLLI